VAIGPPAMTRLKQNAEFVTQATPSS